MAFYSPCGYSVALSCYYFALALSAEVLLHGVIRPKLPLFFKLAVAAGRANILLRIMVYNRLLAFKCSCGFDFLILKYSNLIYSN